jgi:hypothetical protein
MKFGCRGLLKHPEIGRHVNGVLAKRVERNQRQHLDVGGCQDHVSGGAVVMSPQPIASGDTPTVTWVEAGEAILRHRRTEVVTDTALMGQKLRRDHRTDGVTTLVLWAGTAAAIAKEARHGVKAAQFELATQYVLFFEKFVVFVHCHAASITRISNVGGSCSVASTKQFLSVCLCCDDGGTDDAGFVGELRNLNPGTGL